MLKFLVKVFKSLYLLMHFIELVDSVRYWSKILHCIIPPPLSCQLPLGQGHGLRNFTIKLIVEVLNSLYLLMHGMDLVDTWSNVTYWSKALFCTIPTPQTP